MTETKYSHDTANERQRALYRFLSEQEDWVSMEQATDSVKLYPAFFTTIYHNSAARRLLTADIEAINASDAFEKIIIHGNRGIKLATEEEFERFLKAEFAEVFKKLRRVRKLAAKGGRNSQMDIDGHISVVFQGGE